MPLEWNDAVKCIQHYFRRQLHVPSKIPVKQIWRSNTINQYDTKGIKKNIAWVEDEETGYKNEETEEKVNPVLQLRDNFRKQEYDFIQTPKTYSNL